MDHFLLIDSHVKQGLAGVSTGNNLLQPTHLCIEVWFHTLVLQFIVEIISSKTSEI